MNDYGFDYMNYITNIPNSMKYNNSQNMDYMVGHKNMPNMMNKMWQKDKLLDPTEGFIKGNLFANLYDPYKNYKPAELNPKNEREALLYQVMQYKFALIELNLYLDTHPNDKEMIKLYNKYLKTEKQMCDKYESMYGPLILGSEHVGKNTWNWKKSPWPWEGV